MTEQLSLIPSRDFLKKTNKQKKTLDNQTNQSSMTVAHNLDTMMNLKVPKMPRTYM